MNDIEVDKGLDEPEVIEDTARDTENTIQESIKPTRYSFRPKRAKLGKYEKKREFGLHLTVNQAINKLGDEAIKSISKEMKQLVDLEAFHGIKLEDLDYNDKKKIIPSSMFLRRNLRQTAAKVMYLAKRVRPECLVACSFLASRVNVATEEDMSKLMRLLKYLNGTKDIGLRLMGDTYLTVIAFIDASFGVHMDFKSHTGIAIVIGKGVIFAKSTKQKLNSKSSTEAELIAVSDGKRPSHMDKNFFN